MLVNDTNMDYNKWIKMDKTTKLSLDKCAQKTKSERL